jgi:hypothetical protein
MPIKPTGKDRNSLKRVNQAVSDDTQGVTGRGVTGGGDGMDGRVGRPG